MKTVQLTLIKTAGQPIWAISGQNGKPDLIVTEVPDHLATWDVPNAAKAARFMTGRGGQPLAHEIDNDKALPAPSVTYRTLVEAGNSSGISIVLKAKMGRPPLYGDEKLTERVEVRLTPTQHWMLQRLGGAGWLRDQVDREFAKMA